MNLKQKGASLLRRPLVRILLEAAAVVGALVLAHVFATGPVNGLLAAALALAAYVAVVHLLERRAVTELHAAGAPAEAALGLLTGAGLFAAVIGVLWLLGAATVGPGDGAAALPGAILTNFGPAFGEEIVMRGVLFRLLSAWVGDWAALAVSAALFGALHAGNPGATVVSSAAIALEAGVLLGAAFMVTRRLWLPIGLHYGWNFTEGGLFGAAVSGFNGHGVFATRFQGSDLVTGGRFGPEASLVTVAVCLAAGAGMIALARRRNRARR
jgi:CAAX protease family protein